MFVFLERKGGILKRDCVALIFPIFQNNIESIDNELQVVIAVRWTLDDLATIWRVNETLVTVPRTTVLDTSTICSTFSGTMVVASTLEVIHKRNIEVILNPHCRIRSGVTNHTEIANW